MATAAKAKVVPLDEAKGQAPKSGKKMIVIIAAALALLAGGGAGAWFFLQKGGDQQHAEEEADEKPVKKASKSDAGKPPVFIAMEPFTVNLSPDGGEQYLQVALTLQVGEELEVEKIKQYMPLVRSRILMLLAAKKGSELATTEGKEKLQDEIIEVVNKPFTRKGPEQEVSSVLFTSFVIQ